MFIILNIEKLYLGLRIDCNINCIYFEKEFKTALTYCCIFKTFLLTSLDGISFGQTNVIAGLRIRYLIWSSLFA